MLKIDLLRLSEGINPLEMTFSGDIPFFSELDVELDGVGAIGGSIDKRDQDLFVLSCEVTVPVRMTCRRCLGMFTDEVQADITMVAVRSDDNEAENFEKEDVIYLKSSQEWLEMEDMLREHFILNLPAHPICKEDCRGLCSACGADLNNETCNCVD